MEYSLHSQSQLVVAPAMSTVCDIGQLISIDPQFRGGRPCIAGTGVSVRRIVGWYQMGESAEEIANQYPHLSLAQVYAALAYYHANYEQLEKEFRAEEQEEERLLAEDRKLNGRNP